MNYTKLTNVQRLACVAPPTRCDAAIDVIPPDVQERCTAEQLAGLVRAIVASWDAVLAAGRLPS
jgi:hypothetical protein